MSTSRAVVGDDDGVLDAHSTHAGEVDAGLDGHDVTGGQRITGGRGDPRCLVDLETDAVPGPVDECVAPSGGVDDVTARLVDARRSRRRRCTASRPSCCASRTTSYTCRGLGPRVADADACASCRSSTRRRCSRSRSRPARPPRSRDSTAARAAWRRWARTRRSGRSSCRRRPGLASRARARARRPARSAGRASAGGDDGERLVGDRAGGLDAGDLRRLLDAAQLLDEVLGGDQLGLGEPLVGEGPLLRPRDAMGLEPEASIPAGGFAHHVALRRLRHARPRAALRRRRPRAARRPARRTARR